MLQSFLVPPRRRFAGGGGRVLDPEGQSMKLPAHVWLRLVLGCFLAAALVLPGTTLRAQNFTSPWTNLTAGGILPLPPPPPQGEFYQVIFANPTWVVVQNRRGQQFPVNRDLIGQFLIRWQAGLGDLSPLIRVEAVGPEMGSMTIQTNHIDLFMGPEMALVKPGYTSVLPINRPVTAIDQTYQRYMNTFDIAAQNTLYSWVYPTYPGGNGMGTQMHVVGNPLPSFNGISLGVPGMNSVTVFPMQPGVMTITRVTLGSPSFAKKGDAVFLTPVPAAPVTDKSLRAGQIVLYKTIRREEFVE
jgi:hypothetical protein